MDLFAVLRVPRIILTIAGRWPEHNKTKFSVTREIISFTIEIIFKLFLLAELIKFFNDLDVLFDVMASLATATGHLLKIILFKIQAKVWLTLLDQLKSEHFNVYPKECRSGNEQKVGFAKHFGHAFTLGCFCSSTMYVIVPLFSDNDLPLRNSFITEKYITPMYIFQIVEIYLCALTHAAVDVLSVTLMAISVGQMNVLKDKIKHFGSVKMKDKIDLGECVEHHNEIIRFVNNLDTAVTGIILVEYMKSMLVICFLGIQLVYVDPLSAPFARISVYSFIMIFQLAIYCIFGNEILVKSTEISDACYETPWYNFDKKTTSALILIMEKSKRQMFVTSGKYSIVSLQSFAAIMKASYSYFALMQTLYKKHDTSAPEN